MKPSDKQIAEFMKALSALTFGQQFAQISSVVKVWPYFVREKRCQKWAIANAKAMAKIAPAVPKLEPTAALKAFMEVLRAEE